MAKTKTINKGTMSGGEYSVNNIYEDKINELSKYLKRFEKVTKRYNWKKAGKRRR